MNAPLRPGLPPLPERVARLPVDGRGYPVPWFVEWIDGVPDHRVADKVKRVQAVREHRCWICGEPLGRWSSFVFGPMCGVTRVSAEPPSHRDCAEFSVRGCPFLSRPHAHRRTAGLPEDLVAAPGEMIERNPGVSGVWTCASFATIRHPTGLLLMVNDPDSATWWCEGRPATFGEFATSVLSGVPLLFTSPPEGGPDVALRELRAALVRFVAALGCTWQGTDAGPVQFHELMRDALAVAELALARQAEARAA